MSEPQDEPMGAVRRGLHFYARCAREAWRRSWDASKAWPPILGLMGLCGGAWLAGVDLTFPVDIEYGAAIGTALFIVIAWLAVFGVQLVAAPPRLYARLEAELLALAERSAPLLLTDPIEPVEPIVALPAVAGDAPAPVLALPPPLVSPPPTPRPILQSRPAPPPPAARPRDGLQVRLHDQAYETAAVDATGARLPASRAYVARVANRGAKAVRRCQIFFCNPTHVQVVSAPFDLGPGEHRDLPVLRVIDEADEPHALLYFLDARTWSIAAGQAAWLPEPGRFRVKVLSANAPAAALDVTLACSAGAPRAWTLAETSDAEPEAVPKAARTRAAWAAATDVVAGD